jgi:hypothetical protein
MNTCGWIKSPGWRSPDLFRVGFAHTRIIGHLLQQAVANSLSASSSTMMIVPASIRERKSGQEDCPNGNIRIA